MNLTNINRRIKETKEELHKLEEEKSNITESSERMLADLIHEKMCHSNHTDECDWYYDRGDWNCWSRREYLEKARNILEWVDYQTAELVITQL